MDGAYLFTFNGTHGDIAKIYHKSFGDQIHTLEFIMNQQGQLIANDPADDDRFTPPPIQMSAQLGSLPSLREYLRTNYQEMIKEYMTHRDEFFASTIHTIDQETQSAALFKTLHFEGVEDECSEVQDDDDGLYCFESSGRHRQTDNK